ncbi:hypothetical protein HND97_15995 [Vibrio cholerae]|nr:hypothetical protein HND97_15995 [Vibrio cholerae]
MSLLACASPWAMRCWPEPKPIPTGAKPPGCVFHLRKTQGKSADRKMIVASHVDLFGRDLIAVQDVVDWWGLRDWF